MFESERHKLVSEVREHLRLRLEVLKSAGKIPQHGNFLPVRKHFLKNLNRAKHLLPNF